jgi:putative component of toxin-antitoxin plasmid stabilization module
MNKKNIKKALNAKFKAWIDSIEDKTVKKAIKENTIITGGSIVSFILNEEVKDYDVYFRDRETVLLVANYYCAQFNGTQQKDIAEVKIDEESGRIKIVIQSAGVAAEDPEVLESPFADVYEVLSNADDIKGEDQDKNEKKRFRPIFLSSNAITLSDKVQLVIRFWGEPEDIHKNYDFVHCTNYWSSWDNEIVLRPEALEAILAKELRYVGSKYPLCSIIRTRKFIGRGWTINAGQYLKMCFQVSKLDLTDINVLEDQLVGVDSAYFMQLIDGLRAKTKEDPDFVVSDGYLASIVDKLF